MAGHGYEAGRLDLPFVGIATFAKKPYVEDWDSIDADVCILGAPYDFGTPWRSSTKSRWASICRIWIGPRPSKALMQGILTE